MYAYAHHVHKQQYTRTSVKYKIRNTYVVIIFYWSLLSWLYILLANHQRAALWTADGRSGRSDGVRSPTRPTTGSGYAAEPLPLGSAAALPILTRQLAPGTPDTDSCFASTLPWRQWNSVLGTDSELCTRRKDHSQRLRILPKTLVFHDLKELGHATPPCRPVMRRSRSTTMRGARCCKWSWQSWPLALAWADLAGRGSHSLSGVGCSLLSPCFFVFFQFFFLPNRRVFFLPSCSNKSHPLSQVSSIVAYLCIPPTRTSRRPSY